MPRILVFSDVAVNVLELVTLASKLGGEVSVIVVGKGDLSQEKKSISVEGVANIYEATHDSLSDLLPEPLVDALESAFQKANPELILISSTKRGKEVAPRLAARLGIGCISDAMNISMNGNDVSADRVVWGGNAIATVVSRGPVVMTIPPKSSEPAKGSSSPNVVKLEFQPKSMRVAVVEKREKPNGQTSIKDADIVISAGRGIKKNEDLAILEPLAAVLNAALGASRPLTSDLAWVPEDRQVGLSGTTVKPKLYMAVGISGQIQHLTGMRDSKLVTAINQDKNAPIFQESDYVIVGDLYAIVPMLTSSLKNKLGR